MSDSRGYGKLTDGTLLLGPFAQKPTHAPSVEVKVRGVQYFVTYCQDVLSSAQVQQVQRWAFAQMANATN